MTGLIVPKVNRVGRPATLVEYVESYLNRMRAPLKERTTFTSAGRSVVRERGERVILGPRGQKIRVVELPEGGTQVEHGNEQGRGVEHQHAHVRPQCVTLSLAQLGGDPDEYLRERERARVRSSRQILIPRGRGTTH